MFDLSGGCGEYVPDLGQCGVCVGGGAVLVKGQTHLDQPWRNDPHHRPPYILHDPFSSLYSTA